MNHRKQLEELFHTHGFHDFKWIDPKSIVVAQWVRVKCMFGCKEYGNNACCPPNVLSTGECRNFFDEYEEAAIFHFAKRMEKPDERHSWSQSINKKLSRLEREVFLAGNPKTFLLFMDSCNLCTECTKERILCRNKKAARPPPEAMAVDVFSTVTQLGYPIGVLKDYSEAMNRYAFLLVK